DRRDDLVSFWRTSRSTAMAWCTLHFLKEEVSTERRTPPSMKSFLAILLSMGALICCSGGSDLGGTQGGEGSNEKGTSADGNKPDPAGSSAGSGEDGATSGSNGSSSGISGSSGS